MSHKQRVVMYCREFLNNHFIFNYWSNTDFETYYKKHKGSQANAYTFGMETADYLIKNAKPVNQ